MRGAIASANVFNSVALSGASLDSSLLLIYLSLSTNDVEKEYSS